MSDHPAAKPKPDLLKWGLWGAALFGVAAVLYIIVQASTNPGSASDLKAAAKGEMAKLSFPADPTVAPVMSFYGPDGQLTRLADRKGKVLVVNFWATWCPPCIAEMPTFAKLAASYEGQPLEVIPISIDREQDQDKARAFMAQHSPLKFYSEPTAKLPFTLTPPAVGMPTTVIYGADGVELARLSGEADWSGKDAKALLDKALAAR
jgi:thiol-disulfide isomerase/thioredoxin